MELMSRKEAKNQSSKFYFTGLVCPNGHVSKRYTSTSNCFECHGIYYTTAFQKEKQKQYRDSTKDKKAIYDKIFSENNKEYRAALKAANRAKRKHRSVKWADEFTDFVCQEAYHLAKLREQTTGFEWHLDHVIPLCGSNVSGLHVWNNFAVIPAKENMCKKNHFKVE